MASEYPGAVWSPISGKGGLGYTTLANPKIVLHTTETNPAGGGGWPNYSSPPHLTWQPETDEIRQHVTFDKGAYALSSPGSPTSPNYNAGRVIQIEMIGYAADSPEWPAEQYGELADILRWLMAEYDVPLLYPPWQWVGSEGYGKDAATRWQTFDAFAAFSGICAHQNVWANSHSDAGKLSQSKLAEAIQGEPEDEPQPDPDVSLINYGDEGAAVQYWAAILHYRGRDIAEDYKWFDDVFKAALKDELPNASGKKITGRQGAMICNRMWRND